MNLTAILHKHDNESAHEYIFFICLLLLALFLPVSRNMLSVVQIIMAVNWLLEGRFREKRSRFSGNRHAVYLMLVFLVFGVGMLWTSDPLERLWLSMVDKVPFFSLPLLIASSRPLAKERIYSILFVFAFSVLVTAAVGLALFAGNMEASRSALSPFIPHIRFSIQLVMAIFLIPWLAYTSESKPAFRVFSWVAAFLLVAFMFFSGWLTAFISFSAAIVFLAVRKLLAVRSTFIKKIIAVFVLFLLAGFTAGILHFVARPVFYRAPTPLITGQELTREGNPYWHEFENLQRENGHLVFWFIAEDELRHAWNQRSILGFDGPDLKGINPLKGAIYRYMTSRGLRKDSEGLEALYEFEIRAIENGVPNYLHTRWPTLIVRIHQTFWELKEYKRTGNPERFSFAQRIELWKAALAAFSEKPVLGWGKGEVHQAVNFGLEKINSQWQLRNIKPHNQYLLYLITIGAAGFVAVAFLIIIFIKKSGACRYLPFNLMLAIFLSAMAGEDLLDFQESITFFLFFATIFGVMMRRQERLGS
ncbi:MAG TPA: O-antigen ligase family protein [Bacteroidales bacterium]|nr:O-antigen ligase family protein [Bacteroidales bacterium]